MAHRLNMQWHDAMPALQDAVSATISGVNRGLKGWYRTELAEALLGRVSRPDEKYISGRSKNASVWPGLVWFWQEECEGDFSPSPVRGTTGIRATI